MMAEQLYSTYTVMVVPPSLPPSIEPYIHTYIHTPIHSCSHTVIPVIPHIEPTEAVSEARDILWSHSI